MMNMREMFDRLASAIRNVCDVWALELRRILKDEGALLFIMVPFGYSILYSWVYNNEVVHDVPVVVVDESRSQLSREFCRKCDATADVAIVAYASDMAEAKRMVGQQEARGVYHIPSDFATRINRGQQSPIAVYTDMSLMLTYKAIFQTATAVSGEMNSEIQVKLSGNYTDREDEVTTGPLAFHEVAMFNPAGGYGSFILPAVLVLILQQVLALVVGLLAGTSRDNGNFADYRQLKAQGMGAMEILLGKSLVYFMFFAVTCSFLMLVIPRMFGFLTLAQPLGLLAVMLPLLIACVFYAITLSSMIGSRENVMLVVVFTSVPLLFMSGVSWPQSNIPAFWQGVSCLFPSTFGIRSFVRMNTMGATLDDCSTECIALWIQAVAYFIIAYLVVKGRTKNSPIKK